MSEISFENVSKTFGNAKQIGLRSTSLLIEAGHFVTILGASGSGKTTLLKLINRLHKPDTGLVRVAGRDISQVKETALRREIGYVIQHVGLFRHMSVARNIAIVPEILKWPQAKIDSRVDELLNMVGLEPKQYRNRYPRQLSGGQQQRVGLARALAGDPAILLMDEPFGALDAIIREKLQDELIDIQSRLRKTIVFVTHDVQEALKLGDKVIVMNEGQVQQYDTPAAILDNPANAFISQLLGADDPYRHFSFMPAKVLMHRLNPEINNSEIADSRVPVIGENQNLNDALKTLLKAPGNFVWVADNHQQVVGKITLDQLKAASRDALSNGLQGLDGGVPVSQFESAFPMAFSGEVILNALMAHLDLCLLSLGIAILFAFPIGVLISRNRWLAERFLTILGILYTVPSLAMLALLVPLLGLGTMTAVAALVVYAQFILTRHVVLGLQSVDASAIEAARGMGLSAFQIFSRLEAPLAMPVWMGGLRIATLTTISIATTAAWINAGGVGTLIFDGLSQNNNVKIITGVVLISILSLLMDQLLKAVEEESFSIAQGVANASD